MRKTIPLLAFALLAAPAFAAEYTINNLAQLRAFMENVRYNDFRGDTIKLTTDIDCQGGRFNTGDPEHPTTFRGTFDGQGHTISNFVHEPNDRTDFGYGIAMFDYAELGATIRNLTLEGSLPDTHLGAYSAPFVLAVEGPFSSLLLDNCHFRGSVTNYYQAAGLVGYVNSAEGSAILTNCSVRGSIVSTWVSTAGGLVAESAGVEAYDCSVEGEVRGGTSGGLVGEAYGNFFKPCSFERCSFEGVTGPYHASSGVNGGLVGQASNAVFRACTSVVGFDDVETAAGGAAGVTFGSTAFYDCSATVEAAVPYGRFGGFVGWTVGAETFSNCTATMTVDPVPVINTGNGTTNIYSLATGGFAASVSSYGALFVDCTASARGSDLKAGFYYSQKPWAKAIPLGQNTFRRCHAVNPAAKEAGFCLRAWNCAFEGCTVRGGTGRAGFVQSAGGQPDDQWETEYSYAQTSTFTDCSVHGTRARYGFVEHANYSSMNGHTNIFRRCRAGCLYGDSNLSGATVVGFGSLNKGTLAEDCAAYGIADMGHLEAGFASSISVGATVRRCVGAVYPRTTDTQGAGFAEVISYTATVEDCYAVYAPYASAVNLGSEDAWRYGVQGGFVRRTSIGYNADDLPIARCFALWPLSEPNSGEWISGSFCGVTPYDTSTDYFEDCYRPAEAAIGSCHNADAEGVTALTKAEFATATRATMPNYDFDSVWHEPAAVGASSPYLDASVDANTNFWFFSAVIGAEGRILVNGEEPREAYPAGTALTVSAVPDTPGMPFAGWVGDGFADPSAQTTTYTVRNVSAIAAKFCTPIYTVDDWTNMVHGIAGDSLSGNEAFALMNDLDFTGYLATNGWSYVTPGPFTGKFFGQGHTIRGLVTTNGLFSTTQSLFGTIEDGAEIRDLTVEAINVPDDYNTLTLAGLAASVGSGVLISNCHVKVDWQGVCDNHGYPSCLYYGLAQTVSGTNIRIVDCTVEGKLAGGTRACGFVGSATLNGGEIARCAVFADVSTLTNHTDGIAVGFAGSLSLSGGAVVRECFSAGTVDAAGDAAGFAHQIDLRDDESQVRDCYSTAEVLAGVGQKPAGFACRISDINDEGGVLPVANCWFGGTIRCRGKASDYYKPYGFAYYLSGDVSFENCAWIEAPGANEAGTAGVTALPQAESRKAASWPGYDFTNVWSMAEDSTTPYFAWSLADGTDFRLFAMQEPGKTITIPESAAPGSTNAISAVAADNLFLCGWAGGAFYTDAAVTPSALVADNHRTARCVWGKAITTRAELAAITNDLTGVYGLGADIDLAEGGNWTPIGNSEYNKAFAGTLYGQGHAISNLVVDTEGNSNAGLFGYIDHATITDVRLVNPVVRGGAYVGALAGYATGASISGCSVENATVEATGERAGMLVGSVSGSSLSRCSALGSVSSAGRYVGGFAGCAENGSSFSRCFALGSVSSTGGNYNGGFVGYLDGSSASECFACGEVAMSGRNYIGGFVGYASGTSPVSDCYALADVTANRYVGGFAGYATGSGVSFTRCYSAGSTAGSQDTGSFAGYQSSSPTFADCFRPDDGLADVGAADLNGIDALDAAGFLDADTFAAWTAPGGKWTQTDGKTQPYFAWGLVDGKMTLSGKVAGTGGGSISGLGAYAPGTVVPLAAVPSGNAFVGWLGNAPYANASAQTTTIPLDNFRVVTALFGTAISTVGELLAVTNDLAGIYVLTKDIDLGGATIPPLGDDTTAFSGSFYGRNHCLSNFVVESTAKYIGLFGRISGGRVSGVVAKGTVSGASSATDWKNTGTGGFAGAILESSLVEDCSFEGAVANTTTYNTGGFVGYVAGTPGIRRCCFAGTVAHLGSKDDAGGFVGCPNGGSIADCYAVADVEAGGRSYVGGFAGYMGSSAAIATSWCAGRVETTGSNYKGAFAGSASAGKITQSYYDSDKTSLLAVNKAAYNGVTALDSAQMLHEENFNGFDFAKTWKIDEGETTPYLRAFLVQRTAFAAWLEDELNLPPDTDPLTVVNGVPLLARYVYGILPLTGRTDADGRPLVDFGIDADGAPWFQLAPQKMADEYGMQFSVLWSPDLADDWIRAPGDEWPKEIRFDADDDGNDDTCHPPVDADIDPQMFFKYKIVIDD